MILGAYEYLMRRHDNDQTDMSRFFIYYNARAMNPRSAGIVRDRGCVIGYAIEAIKRLGTCTENRWEFNEFNKDRKPTPECYTEAKNYTVTDAVQVPMDLDSLRTCLARGYPFVFGARLFESFVRAANNGGFVSLPQPDEKPLKGAER